MTGGLRDHLVHLAFHGQGKQIGGFLIWLVHESVSSFDLAVVGIPEIIDTSKVLFDHPNGALRLLGLSFLRCPVCTLLLTAMPFPVDDRIFHKWLQNRS